MLRVPACFGKATFDAMMIHALMFSLLTKKALVH